MGAIGTRFFINLEIDFSVKARNFQSEPRYRVCVLLYVCVCMCVYVCLCNTARHLNKWSETDHGTSLPTPLCSLRALRNN